MGLILDNFGFHNVQREYILKKALFSDVEKGADENACRDLHPLLWLMHGLTHMIARFSLPGEKGNTLCSPWRAQRNNNNVLI